MVPFDHLPIEAPPWKAAKRRHGRRRYQVCALSSHFPKNVFKGNRERESVPT
jgi:hypothetical protein